MTLNGDLFIHERCRLLYQFDSSCRALTGNGGRIIMMKKSKKKIVCMTISTLILLFAIGVSTLAEDNTIDVVGTWTGCQTLETSVNNVFIIINEDGTGSYYNDIDEEIVGTGGFVDMTWSLAGPALVIDYNGKQTAFLVSALEDGLSMVSSEGTTLYKEEDESATESDSTDVGNNTFDSVKLNVEDFVGDWRDINSFGLITLNGDGSGNYRNGTYQAVLSWEIGTGELIVTGGEWVEDPFSIEAEEGIVKMICDNYCFMRFSDIPMIEQELNEEVSDGEVSITLKSVEFVNNIPDELYNKLKSWGREYGEESILEDGQVYACVNFQFVNNGKNSVVVGDFNNLLRVYLDYADGYLYSTDDSYYSYYYDGTSFSGYKETCLGKGIEVQPLQKKDVTVYLRCSEVVSTDTESPINIIFISSCNPESIGYFRYSLPRGEEGT